MYLIIYSKIASIISQSTVTTVKKHIFKRLTNHSPNVKNYKKHPIVLGKYFTENYHPLDFRNTTVLISENKYKK